MHEISLVQNLLEQLRDLAHQNNAQRILRVKMVIGPLSGVVIDSFTFGFDILTKQEQLFDQATLEISIPKVVFRCVRCGHEMETDGQRPSGCLACSEPILMPEGGDDLILQQVELE
ncbi:hydrogenase maturation nickel metallochaperone HypA [Desulfofustis limnaeus]|jgi:hydrogenase nickel incorporation protein HypA/HybF|uniref:Hydrogenase maturation factor HypA n=1 Tax=Desulfofustis limnaeus TaxID=2740163 RepID=A0ABM7WEG2_9BACT|nr:hydrogenase maturation nickel metallochaperone HypA [Desulfofustis limnaeus]MDX9896995.1 hydrogenase maturation nickel metallochaperone HypA [Desulfofustis sp.]BDD89369.1 hypothetical protein DPPLL_37340 [Desulfofustis limnaeus]